jgi:hypothetical protein
MPSFRLDQEPWIPTVGLDGSSRFVSLEQVFRDSVELSSIVGKPLEVAGILRLLLTILHLSFAPKNLEEWREIWEARRAAMEKAAQYVREQETYWDLYCTDRPFLQASELADVPGSPLDPDFLDRSKSGRDPHVDHGAYADSLSLESAAAARTLLGLNLFCVGGMGTPNPLIPPRGKDLDRFSSNSIAAQSCICFLEGRSLAETMILNLLAGERTGVPGWESAVATSRDRRPSTGLADSYTRPVRTVLLFPSADGSRAEAAFVTSGAPFEELDSETDPMIPHVKGSKGYYPLQLDAGVALWRSAHVLLANHDKPLRLVDQVRRLASRFDLESNEIRLRLVGLRGKSGQAKHYFWRDESLPFGLSVLVDNKRSAELENAIKGAKETADVTRRRIYAFAARYLQNGAEANPDKKDVVALADELSPDVHDYWSILAPMGERIACDDFDEHRWNALLKEASETAYRKAIDRLQPDARRFRAEYVRTSTREGANA